MGDDRGQRGLAGAGRAEEYGAGQPVGLYGAAQQPSLADDVLLTDEFVQRARPHSVGERRVVAGVLRKQILHGIKPRAGRPKAARPIIAYSIAHFIGKRKSDSFKEALS